MTLAELADAIATVPRSVQERATVLIYLNDHQAVVAEEVWMDAEDEDQLVLGPPGAHRAALLRSRRRVLDLDHHVANGDAK